ncbi:MAG: KH domain-containing protein [Candidatus Parvarchaeota archaeon]|nr:KH domain-containing protein [Candidatus Rehaiarchaeum fermentans]
MIEKKIIREGMAKLAVKEALLKLFKGYPVIDINIDKTPLGYRVIIYSHKPSVILGRAGDLIEKGVALASKLLNNESVRLQVEQIENPDLDPRVVAERIKTKLERYGFKKYKKIGDQELEIIRKAGARGAEIEIGGIIKERADHVKFRFVGGVLPKSGNVEQYGVRRAARQLIVKRGAIGIKVTIVLKSRMPGELEVNENGGSESTGTKE